MRRSRSEEAFPLDPEIERTLKGLRRQQREKDKQEAEMANRPEQVADTRALREFALPKVTEVPAVIRKPTIDANNFEIKPAILQMIQTSV